MMKLKKYFKNLDARYEALKQENAELKAQLQKKKIEYHGLICWFSVFFNASGHELEAFFVFNGSLYAGAASPNCSSAQLMRGTKKLSPKCRIHVCGYLPCVPVFRQNSRFYGYLPEMACYIVLLLVSIGRVNLL